MPAYKDEKRNTWLSLFYYEDWQGNKKKKQKRGFKTKKEALILNHAEISRRIAFLPHKVLPLNNIRWRNFIHFLISNCLDKI